MRSKEKLVVFVTTFSGQTMCVLVCFETVRFLKFTSLLFHCRRNRREEARFIFQGVGIAQGYRLIYGVVYLENPIFFSNW